MTPIKRLMAKNKAHSAKLLVAFCLALVAAAGQAAIVPRLKQGENLTIAAIGTSLTVITPWFGQLATWQSYVPDGIHPNALGAQNVIVPEIERALNSQAPEPGAAALLTTGLLCRLAHAWRKRR